MDYKPRFFFVFLVWSYVVFGQQTQGLHFVNPSMKKLSIAVELVNNLMVVPMQLNGVELSFLIDTGVDKTLLIALDANDSLELKNTRKMNIQGLGTDDYFEAFQSTGNTLQFQDAVFENKTLYFIVDENSELSNRLGLPVNGIIGYDFFENFIVKMDYIAKKITLYNPAYFSKKLRRYQRIPLTFYKNKPYLQVQVEDATVTKDSLNFLMDTGNGSSFWFVENPFIQLPKVYFEDVLGYGISSPIYGKRSRIDQVKLGKYSFKKPKVAYPDIHQLQEIEPTVTRDGTIGTEILRRFTMYIDYPNKQLFIKANKHFNDSFNYDMSGLEFMYDGVKLVESYKRVPINTNSTNSEYDSSNRHQLIVTVAVKSKLLIQSVRDNSPAKEAGILPGDELLSINGRAVYDLRLETIQSILSKKEGEKVVLKFQRGNNVVIKEIFLRDRLEDLMQMHKN